MIKKNSFHRGTKELCLICTVFLVILININSLIVSLSLSLIVCLIQTDIYVH